MKSVHNVSLAEYRTKYMEDPAANKHQLVIDDKDPDDELEDEIEEDGEIEMEMEENVEIVQEEEGNTGVKAASPGDLEGDSPPDGELRRWYEGCSYVCIPCNKEQLQSYQTYMYMLIQLALWACIQLSKCLHYRQNV